MLLEYSWDIEDCSAAGTKQGAVGVARRGAGWLLDTGRGLVAVDTRARTSSTLVKKPSSSPRQSASTDPRSAAKLRKLSGSEGGEGRV